MSPWRPVTILAAVIYSFSSFFMTSDISTCSLPKTTKNSGKSPEWFFYDKEKKFYLMKIEVFLKSFSFVDVEALFHTHSIISDQLGLCDYRGDVWFIHKCTVLGKLVKPTYL